MSFRMENRFVSVSLMCDRNQIVIQGPEVFGPYIGESEEQLRAKFKEAAQSSQQKKVPVILFIDEIVSFTDRVAY